MYFCQLRANGFFYKLREFLTLLKLSNGDNKVVSSENDIKINISLDSQKSLVNKLKSWGSSRVYKNTRVK